MQIATALRYLIAIFGGALATKGIIPQSIVDKASNLEELTQVVGVLMAAGSLLYGMWLRRPAGMIKATSKLHQVAEIRVPEHLADAINVAKVVPAGAR